MSHKANNFHTMISIKDFDICSFNHPPMFSKGIVDSARSNYPNLIHDCPYRAGEKFNINYTFNDATCDKMRAQKKPSFNMGLHYFPDGDYKITVTIFDSLDSVKINYFFKVNTGDQRRV
jgi:hypothetical protein